jgi:hypothetical protein
VWSSIVFDLAEQPLERMGLNECAKAAVIFFTQVDKIALPHTPRLLPHWHFSSSVGRQM